MGKDRSKSISFVNSKGESVALSNEEVLSRGLNSWKGWRCSAGIENLYINADGNIYIATCKSGGIRGNVFDDRFGIGDFWAICPNERCMCGQDMQLRKAKDSSLIPNTDSEPPEPNVDEIKDVEWVVPYHYESYKSHPKNITWDLGRRCNYSCNYCNPSISNTYEAHKTKGSLDHAIENIERNFLHDSKARWIFTGGEPTINPYYLEMVKKLRFQGHLIHTQTNGSRSAEYHAELIEYSSIGISLHLDFYREELFLKMCKAVKDKQKNNKEASLFWFGIRIMVPPGRIMEALEIKSKVKSLPEFETFQNIYLSPLYKTGFKEWDKMVSYDKKEYEEITANA